MNAELIEIDDARQRVLDCTTPLPSERVRLADALGRVLAEGVGSDGPIPPFDSSAMDGFALRFADVCEAGAERPVRLSVVAESRAGHPSARAVGAGEAVAISTGAIVPPGADAIVPVERTHAHNGHVDVLAAVPAGNDVRRAGEDIGAGQPVLAAGEVLGPAQLGVLASVGRAQLACSRRPRLALLTTGDELVEPGHELPRGSIYNSNSYAVAALAREAGAEVQPTATARDRTETTSAAISDALADCDVLVICGGVSVGAHDHVKASLAALGVEQRFWGVALKPGKPTWFGLRDRTLVFGLPGNPVSAIVTFTLFVAPALRALAGAAADAARTTATIAVDYAKPAGRAHAVRCRLRAGDTGWTAAPTGAQGSHVLTSMLDADALALIPSQSTGVRAGERVVVELLPGARPGFG
ncbi:MAG TPA: gephyrin-like molybdotransferase Glp [Solirubrobacteraceae bacterium]|jgi:molybdopterin molybdotransferase|nr:gephyrin-like molybdotransferase Glp [Solirubrobacteraceae bacterium]